jgi:predicted transcriptional regulator
MSIKLGLELRDRLSFVATSRKSTPHALAREAIEYFVTTEEAKALANTDASAVWEHYQETGLHATHSEVETWMKSWGTDKELTAPESHA